MTALAWMPATVDSSLLEGDGFEQTRLALHKLAKLVAEARELGGREAWIYFIDDMVGGATKIGFSADPVGRLRDLQVANPNTLTLRTIFYAPLTLERILHRELAEHRIAGEWFDAQAVAPYADVLHKITISEPELRRRAERVLGLERGDLR